MGEWRTVSLSELAEINPTSAAPLSRHTYIDYLDISSVGEGEQVEDSTRLPVGKAPSRAKRQVAHGDTLLSMVRPGRRSMLWLQNPSEETVASTGFLVLRAKNQVVDPRFLYYTVFNPTFTDYLVTREKGAAYPAVTATDVLSAKINIPPLMEQREIASILGALDDKLELNRRMNATLEAMARALFQSWFVDFDPVHAKAEGRQPVGMDAETAALFPDSFEDSALGPIPKGWQLTNVKGIGDVITGKTPSTVDPRNFGDDVPFITIPDMHNKTFATVTARRLSTFGAQAQPSKSLPAGTLCVSCIATPGLVIITAEVAQTNQQINAVIPNDRDETYYWFWVLKNLGADISSHGSGGSVLSNLSKGGFESLQIMKPPTRLIKKYAKIVEPLFGKIRAVALESESISVARDTLLPKLLSGDLRVGDVAA